MPLQIRRTPTPSNPPTGLADGQLAIGQADNPPSLWVGVPAGIDPSGRKLINPAFTQTANGLVPFPGVSIPTNAALMADGSWKVVPGTNYQVTNADLTVLPTTDYVIVTGVAVSVTLTLPSAPIGKTLRIDVQAMSAGSTLTLVGTRLILFTEIGWSTNFTVWSMSGPPVNVPSAQLLLISEGGGWWSITNQGVPITGNPVDMPGKVQTANAAIGATPPPNPARGDFWWDDVGAQLYVFDASDQWVVAVNQPAGGGGLDETAVNDLIAAALASYTPPLPSPTTGTGSWVRYDSPSLRQPLIMGKTDGAGAGIGNVGQVLVASSNNFNFSMTTGVKTTAVTLTLAAGTYLVSGSISLIAGTTITQAVTELSALQSVGGVAGNALMEWYGNSLTVIHNLGPAQIGFNSTNNVNLAVQATYTGGMQEGRATLVAQRIV